MVMGIANRTENWKTARYLSPFFGERAVLLAQELGAIPDAAPADVKLELFWKGVRDWRHEKNGRVCDDSLVQSCRRQYEGLREEITRSDLFRDLQPKNYAVSSDDHRDELVNNLRNTEIDIVLESPGHLYIGEAKFESNFDANGNFVLVHQLVRQYVMANVLLDVVGCARKVVPFVVTERGAIGPSLHGDTTGSTRRPHQVQFMIDQGWMDEAHCLTWDDLVSLAST